MLANQIQGLSAVGVYKAVEEEGFAPERAENWRVHCLPDGLSKTEQQAVGKIDEVGRRLVLHPIDKLEDFLALKSVFAFQNRNSHLAEHLWIGRDRSTRGETQNCF